LNCSVSLSRMLVGRYNRFTQVDDVGRLPANSANCTLGAMVNPSIGSSFDPVTNLKTFSRLMLLCLPATRNANKTYGS